MTRQNIASLLLITLAGLTVAACQTTTPQSTSVDRVLKAPNISNAPYKTVLAVGAVPSRETSRNIETALMEHLSSKHVKVHSFVRESDSKVASEEAIRALVEKTGADGVIVVSGKIAGAALEERGEQTADYQPQVRGGSLFNFFRYDYKNVTRAGYIDYTTNVIFVADFYDVASGDRIHSVESSVAHGQSGYDIIMAEGEAIADRLRTDGIVR